MTEFPGPLHSMVFRTTDLPVLFHRTDTVAIAHQREAVGATRYQLFLLVAGAALAAFPSSLKPRAWRKGCGSWPRSAGRTRVRATEGSRRRT